MATILLLDSNEVACKAMQGILAHGRHRGIVATGIPMAWKILRERVRIDLVIAELVLKGERGVDFLMRLRGDYFLKSIPVVIYTSVADPATVRKVLEFRVQNYLVKPYNEEDIFREVTKAAASRWRDLQFEEEKSFCAQMMCTKDELLGSREDLMRSLTEESTVFAQFADGHSQLPQVNEKIDGLSGRAEMCGVWAVVDYMKWLKDKAALGHWEAFRTCEVDMRYVHQLISFHLNPNQEETIDMTAEEQAIQKEAEARAIWMKKDVDLDGPVVKEEEVMRQLEALPACPVIDTVGAAFQMLAENSHADNLKRVTDLVSRDPGLVAQVLISAHKLERDAASPIVDLPTAVGLLGNVKLAALGKTLPTIPERHVNFPPITWPNMWMFQIAVGRVAQFTAKYLEFGMVGTYAQTAGLIQDIGKLLLLKLFPFGFGAAVHYSREHGIPLHEAEKKYIGCTSREMGYHFAVSKGLPEHYCNVIKWVEDPAHAKEDLELVGVVALARHLCLHNHVGYCGDTPKDVVPHILESAAWKILQPKVFPTFDLGAFSTQVHAYCVELKQLLAGHKIH